MMKTFVFVSACAVLLAVLSLSSCSGDTSSGTPDGATNGEEPRVVPPENSPVTCLNPDDYALHFKDTYADDFFLNSIPSIATTPAGMYAYHGKFVHLNVSYPVSLIYHKDTKTFAADMGYLNDEVMLYHCQRVSEGLYKGSYTFSHANSSAYKKQRPITCNLLKGTLPE